ncbi:MAG: Hpt domain-containing protein [Pirellulaceae bacterium]|jgi:HPt (histidine-containing phosphotransfer) domain-containing protein|nr:Hpt domain-containing protein [Pirellulaceae bacterium]
MTEKPTSSEQVVDWAAALKSTDGDEAMLIDLIPPFLEEAQERLSHIHDALNSQDYVLANRSAHTLKSLLRTFGASSAMLLAEQLEDHFGGLAADHRAIEKGTKDPSVITPERIAAVFADAPRMVAEFEPQLHRVLAAVKARLKQ